MSDNITYIINIFLDSVPIFIGYFIVNNDVTPNIVEFYENGNPNNANNSLNDPNKNPNSSPNNDTNNNNPGHPNKS